MTKSTKLFCSDTTWLVKKYIAVLLNLKPFDHFPYKISHTPLVILPNILHLSPATHLTSSISPSKDFYFNLNKPSRQAAIHTSFHCKCFHFLSLWPTWNVIMLNQHMKYELNSHYQLNWLIMLHKHVGK